MSSKRKVCVTARAMLAFLMILGFGQANSDQFDIDPERFIYIAVGEVMVPVPSYYGIRETSINDGFFYVSMVSHLYQARLNECGECGGGFVTFTNDPDASRVRPEYAVENEVVSDVYTYGRYKYSDLETDSEWDSRVAIFQSGEDMVFIIESEQVQDAIWKRFLDAEEKRSLLSGNDSSVLGSD